MVDAAVARLAESITQLTLCQVIADEVDAATKLLDKACQKLQGIPDVPAQRITDFEKHRKTYCSCRAQPKVPVRSLKNLMHHARMRNTISLLMKTTGKSTSALKFTTNHNDGAMRDVRSLTLVVIQSELPLHGAHPTCTPGNVHG